MLTFKPENSCAFVEKIVALATRISKAKCLLVMNLMQLLSDFKTG
jgi:hypothetical protein